MTFTKEQLREKLEHRITVAAKYPDVEEAQLDADIFKLALSALAGLEAEPVFKINHESSLIKHVKKVVRETSSPQPLTTSERAELENYRNAQQVVPDVLPCPVKLEPGMRFGKGIRTEVLLGALQRRAKHMLELDAMTPEQRAEHDAGVEEFKAMLSQAGHKVEGSDDGRDQFEEWFKFHHGDEHSIVTLHRANGGLNYRDPHVDLAWIAWKDSRAAMQSGAQSVYEKILIAQMENIIADLELPVNASLVDITNEIHRLKGEAGLKDGWVACSERMPEVDGNYWGWWSESKRQGPVWFIKSELQEQFQSAEVTHWMPLPAAPQQEG